MSDTPERAEIRAAGITCPSCGQNFADLTGTDHAVELSGGNLPASLMDGTAKCADGQQITLAEADFDTVRMLANLELLTAYERNWQAAVDEMIPRAPLTGFLGSG